jgi:hypothetical protein
LPKNKTFFSVLNILVHLSNNPTNHISGDFENEAPSVDFSHRLCEFLSSSSKSLTMDKGTKPEAVFLVMSDPSMNEL